MVNEPNIDVDGFLNLEAGANAGIAPNLLPANQYAFGINTQIRSGYPSNRPGFRKLALTFQNGENEYAFLSGGFQGAMVYQPSNALPYHVACIGGRVWKVPIDPSEKVSEIQLLKSDTLLVDAVSFVVPAVGLGVQITTTDTTRMDIRFTSLTIGGKSYELLTIDSATTFTASNVDDTPGNTVAIATEITFQIPDRNASNLDQAWMVQAERYLIIQDNQSLPIIFDGASARRSSLADQEVPTGTVMAYGNGRLAVAKGRNFVIGDIVGGPSGTAVNNFEDAVLKFTENEYLNGGGEFTFPLQTGDITAMIHIANLDSSLGQGQLLVFTPGAVASVNLPPERETWASITYPIQTVTLINNGAMAHESTVLVNGDGFFRGRDGIRSAILAQRQFGEWANTPISREVDRILRYDSQGLLKHGSAIVFNNRLLITVSPIPQYNARSSHKGIISLDFDPVSTMRQKAAPAYDPLWTGIEPTQLVVGRFDGVERAFAFVRNNVGLNELWEITTDSRFDNADDTDVRIAASIESRSFTFQGQQRSAFPVLRELDNGDLFVDQLVGTVNFAVDYRPDQYPVWNAWHSWSMCATEKDCTAVDGCLPNKTLLPQYRTRMGLPKPADTDETTDNKPMRRGFEFQTRIAWTGACRLRGFRIKALNVTESVYGSFDSGTCVEIDNCETDPFTYNVVTYTTGPEFDFSVADNSMNLIFL